MRIAEMMPADYDAFLDLMRRIPEMHLREADSRASIARYLERNPGFSFMAWEGDRLAGCALCGHDGRRGYLQHVMVDPAHRGRGLAHVLVTRCLDALEAVGILKTHIDVYVTNEGANRYWARRGWQKRNDIYRYSFSRSENPDV